MDEAECAREDASQATSGSISSRSFTAIWSFYVHPKIAIRRLDGDVAEQKPDLTSCDDAQLITALRFCRAFEQASFRRGQQEIVRARRHADRIREDHRLQIGDGDPITASAPSSARP